MSGSLTDKLPNSDDNLTTVMKVVKDLTIKVEALNEKVELRLYDTKPMWEQVLKTVLEIKEGQQRLEQRQESLEQRQLSLEQKMEQLALGQIQLQENDQKTGQGLDVLRRESHEIKTFCRDLMRRLSIFNDTLVTIQSDYRDIYDRVRLIEQSMNETQQVISNPFEGPDTEQ